MLVFDLIHNEFTCTVKTNLPNPKKKNREILFFPLVTCAVKIQGPAL